MGEYMSEETYDQNENQEQEESYELGFSDKVIGVFTEPAALFEDLSSQKPRVTDWAVPLLLIILLAIGSQFIVMNTPSLRQAAIEKRMDAVADYFDNLIEEGQMTQEIADRQLETIRGQIEDGMDSQLPITILFMFIIITVMFFLASGLYFLIIRFLLKGDGSYNTGLSAYGLPMYITSLGVVLLVIIMLVTNNIYSGLHLAEFMGMDSKQLIGYMVSYINPISIWFYLVLGIAYNKMFKLNNLGKSLLAVFGTWFIVGMLFFAVSEFIPFLKNFIQ
jgi:hypothetical protein